MKIGIIGDTHGSKQNLEIIYDKFKGVDFFIHTGDHWKDGALLEKRWQAPVLTVKGNCDFSDFSRELSFSVEGRRFFLTHGHDYRVKYGLQSLFYRAKELDVQYCIYGHTHVPHIEMVEGILFLNPGSLTWPRSGEKYAGILLEYREGLFLPQFVS